GIWSCIHGVHIDMKKKKPELNFSPQANMLHLLKSAKSVALSSPKRNTVLLQPSILDVMTGKGFLSLSGRHKNLLNNAAPFSVQQKGSSLQTSPNKPHLSISNDNGKSRLAGLAGDASKPRALWKKSVETLKTQPSVISPGLGPGSSPAPGPGPPPMKSQRYLPEEPPPPHSDISECSSRPPSHKDSDSMGARGGFKAINQLRKRGGGTGGGGSSKIYSIDSDQASLQSAPLYQRDSQGGGDDHSYPPDLFPLTAPTRTRQTRPFCS
ncbi:unnamed protein product, partial [Tetraodon nigroviridis]